MDFEFVQKGTTILLNLDELGQVSSEELFLIWWIQSQFGQPFTSTSPIPLPRPTPAPLTHLMCEITHQQNSHLDLGQLALEEEN